MKSNFDVFLSYAKEDERLASELVSIMEKRGLRVFWDRHIPPGHYWRDYLGSDLEEASAVVVLWSNFSMQSQWVIEEAEEAAKQDALSRYA